MKSRLPQSDVIPRPKRSDQHALTWLDVLLCLACISILGATAVSALPKSQAQQAVAIDFDNMHRLTMACQMYALDSGGYEPAPGWGIGAESWAYSAGPGYGYSNQIVALKAGQLWPYIKDPKVFVCPTDSTNTAAWRLRTILTTSYNMNGAVCGFGGLPDGRSYQSALFKSDRIQFIEADRNQPFYFNDGSFYPDEGIATTHLGAAVTGDFGGQAELVTRVVYFGNGFAGSAGGRGSGIPTSQLPNRIWCNPGDRNGL